jgi:hypothetical protein
VIANWSPACELVVSFAGPFAELIVVPLTEGYRGGGKNGQPRLLRLEAAAVHV